jgi:L-ascorbate metabolism protein UlaG (beta-lactamase superfamily)
MQVFKKMMLYFSVIVAVLALATYLFLQSAVFGGSPHEAQLKKIKASPNYKNGSFQNLSPTTVSLPKSSFFKVLQEFIFNKEETEPKELLQVIKTDLKNLKSEEPLIIWFGHSSYLMLIDGKTILVDPVFNRASPIPLFGKPFRYTYHYSAHDFPEIDLLIITHDHYDHLDYQTIKKLIPKTKNFIVPLGVEAHLAHWGAKNNTIKSLDWYQETELLNFKITATPARHFSGRKFTRGNTLWSSFVLKTDKLNIYLGGDSGYDTHFKTIGEQYGPFDLAILECGQYGINWPLIHMFPEQVAQAATDLKAKQLLPVHWAKFSLALHNWTEPIEKLTYIAKSQNINLQTPRIGEPLSLTKMDKQHLWWKK